MEMWLVGVLCAVLCAPIYGAKPRRNMTNVKKERQWSTTGGRELQTIVKENKGG